MRISCLLILPVLLVSCVSLNDGAESRTITVFYENIPPGASILLDRINIDPEHILSEVSKEIPELIKSCLHQNGFIIAEDNSEYRYNLYFFLTSNTWQDQYKPVESVTLSIRLYRDGNLAAYRLHTENTEKSINSFSLIFDLIEKNIGEFTETVGNEN